MTEKIYRAYEKSASRYDQNQTKETLRQTIRFYSRIVSMARESRNYPQFEKAPQVMVGPDRPGIQRRLFNTTSGVRRYPEIESMLPIKRQTSLV